jgi:predicted ThiF/HesA family dinucleotide-utilizing enzyme
LAAWLAVIEHEPPATIDKVLLETVHTEGVVDAKVTGKPDEELALNVESATPNVTLLNGENVIIEPHGGSVLPVTTVVLAVLMKFGTFDVAPIGAKLTVAVMAEA